MISRNCILSKPGVPQRVQTESSVISTAVLALHSSQCCIRSQQSALELLAELEWKPQRVPRLSPQLSIRAHSQHVKPAFRTGPVDLDRRVTSSNRHVIRNNGCKRLQRWRGPFFAAAQCQVGTQSVCWWGGQLQPIGTVARWDESPGGRRRPCLLEGRVSDAAEVRLQR